MVHECWNGQILWVDLSNKTSREETLDNVVYEQFIGGKGLGAYLLYRTLKEGVDPLGPENVLFFMNGPLQGLPAPSVGRWSLITKSPMTGLFLDTHCGGPLGREIKRAGYDAICLIGKAKAPVILLIEDKKVSFEDASHLWGKDVHTTTHASHDTYGEKHAVYTIGPAGENQVLFATGCCEIAHQTGRGGAGAVLGSKNLKAIVVRGTGEITPFDYDKMREILKEVNQAWFANPTPFKDYGSPFLVEVANKRGQYPTRNWETGFFKNWEGLEASQVFENYNLGNHHACPHCVMRCTHAFRTDNPDSPGSEVESMVEYETFAMLGGNIGVDDPKTVFRLNYLCDKLGLDTISTGSVLAFATELYKRDILSEEDIGFSLDWGDGQSYEKLIRLIAAREGIGEILSLGTKMAAEKIGKDSIKYAVQVKGLETAAWDPRGKKGLGLSYATAEVGSSHLRGWPSTNDYPSESALDVVDSMVEARDEKHLTDSLVVCHFTFRMPLVLSQKIEFLNAASGLSYTEKSISQFGKRVEALTRMFNIREGVTKTDDILPPRFWEPEKGGPADGMRSFIDQEDFEASLQKYYKLRGWSKDGIPTEAALEKLGLKELVG